MASQTSDEKAAAKIIGEKIRQRRKAVGLSQKSFGEALGLAPAQIVKYERGDNRVAASRLVRMAVLLECSTVDLMPDQGEHTGQRAAVLAFMSSEQGMRLAMSFMVLPIAGEARDTVIRLIEIMGKVR